MERAKTDNELIRTKSIKAFFAFHVIDILFVLIQLAKCKYNMLKVTLIQ